MILIDSNIFMYAAGAEHPHKEPSRVFLEQVALGQIDAALDTEVLQEVLHRYRSLRRWPEGGRVYDLARQIVPLVIPITVETLDKARTLLDRYPTLSARDALHAAVVQTHGARAICSYDSDFDGIEGVERIEPPAIGNL
ncbi:MAG TPA: type II toxin-antitoxin system VapC family toxin [Thermoanaerobaculia bacterium]|nr:type II toxin-antitoxin system VapC family toxin [Thermoanaerobaculia bacterium]